MKDELVMYWKKYLPLKYAKRFKVNKEKKIIPEFVKSNRHQTESYKVQMFFKPISRY